MALISIKDVKLFPACAGVIPQQHIVLRPVQTFPRMCGGDPYIERIKQNKSPLFPACAGVILLPRHYPGRHSAFPRMCGGDPEDGDVLSINNNFSPHVRG